MVLFTADLCQVGRSREVLSDFYSRSSRTSPVSPSAQRWIRRVGAPSTQRPCNGGQVDIRAHPPIEPARDQSSHHQDSVASGSHAHGGGGSSRGTARRPSALGLEHTAIAQERIEDAGEATGEGDHGHLFPAACGDARGPGPQLLRLRRWSPSRRCGQPWPCRATRTKSRLRPCVRRRRSGRRGRCG